MDLVRRSAFCILALALASTAGACGADRTKETAFGSVQSEAISPYVADTWSTLPRSPLGDWTEPNWVWLADGSGFVQAGAAELDGTEVRSTRRAAWFAFADRRYSTLPELPVKAGLGWAGGAWIGDTLVLVGQDCPPVTANSMTSVEFCAEGGAGAKVVLTYRTGDAGWIRRSLPDWIHDFDASSPEVIGVIGDRLVLTVGMQPTRVGTFEPTTGQWELLADGPDVEPLQESITSAPGATTTMGAAPNPSRTYRLPTAFCVIGQEITAYSVTPAYGVTVGYFEPGFWRLGTGGWELLRVPVPGPLESAACTTRGFAVTAPASSNPVTVPDPRAATAAQRLTFMNPLDGAVTELGLTAGSVPVDPRRRFANAVIMSDGSVVSPTGTVPMKLDPNRDVLVGSYAIRTNDGTHDRPAIALLSGL